MVIIEIMVEVGSVSSMLIKLNSWLKVSSVKIIISGCRLICLFISLGVRMKFFSICFML